MASIDVVRDANGRAVKFRARYRTPEGAQRSKTFTKKVDAERFLTSVEHTKNLGAYVDPSAGRRTFGDYAPIWLAAQVSRESTQRIRARYLALYALPTFGSRPLGAVRPTEVQSWVRVLSERYDARTVAHTYRLVAAVFRAAVRDRVIAASPCIDIKLPKKHVTPIEPLTIEQVETLAATIRERYRAIVILAAGTGMRQGECLGLTVDRIDFLRRSVRVDQQLVSTDRQPGTPNYPQGGE